MSVRINVSFQEDWEADDIMELLKPILPGFKVKKGKGTGVYKHLYIMPRDVERTPNEAQMKQRKPEKT